MNFRHPLISDLGPNYSRLYSENNETLDKTLMIIVGLKLNIGNPIRVIDWGNDPKFGLESIKTRNISRFNLKAVKHVV